MFLCQPSLLSQHIQSILNPSSAQIQHSQPGPSMLSSIIFYQAPSPSYMQPWASQISTRTINGLILNLHLHLSSVSSSFIKIFILIFLHQFLLPSSVSSSCVNASVFLFITSTPTDQCQDRACPPLQRHLPARKPPLLRCLQRP